MGHPLQRGSQSAVLWATDTANRQLQPSERLQPSGQNPAQAAQFVRAGWATAAETQTAYPRIQANLSGAPKAATANMTNTANGWQVVAATKTGDGSIVE